MARMIRSRHRRNAPLDVGMLNENRPVISGTLHEYRLLAFAGIVGGNSVIRSMSVHLPQDYAYTYPLSMLIMARAEWHDAVRTSVDDRARNPFTGNYIRIDGRLGRRLSRAFFSESENWFVESTVDVRRLDRVRRRLVFDDGDDRSDFIVVNVNVNSMDFGDEMSPATVIALIDMLQENRVDERARDLLSSLLYESRQYNAMEKCVACMFNVSADLLVPCRHLVTCVECTGRCRNRCPVCREKIEIVVRHHNVTV